MNNQDLINQMNQNAALYYLADECSRPMTDIEATVFIGVIGFFVLLTILVLWLTFHFDN